MASPKVRFNSARSDFHTTLKARVDAYFDERQLSRHADAAMWLKIAFWLTTTAAVFTGLLIGALPGAFVLVLGFCFAQTGFNVGHDAIHGATSRHPWVNVMLGWCFDVLGASSFNWSVAHNFVHHTYTNVPGADHDLEPGPWMRFYASEKVPAFYRWQHLFAFGFYSMTTLVWVFLKDFVQVSIPDPRTGKRQDRVAIAKVVSSKIAHFALFLVLPVVVTGRPIWHIAIGYVLMHMVTGVTLAVVFQLAHVVEGTDFPRPSATGDIADGWAEHQVRTTANFGVGSGLTLFLTGGLNHQVEHHLFPRISHTHYGALAGIVKDTAHEFGLPYHCQPSFGSALLSHVRVMKRFGRGTVTATTPTAVLPVASMITDDAAPAE